MWTLHGRASLIGKSFVRDSVAKRVQIQEQIVDVLVIHDLKECVEAVWFSPQQRTELQEALWRLEEGHSHREADRRQCNGS